MSIFDEIPKTKQGLITYRRYAEQQIKDCNSRIKRMEKILEELDKRERKMDNG
jgi:uncharacterized protein involved in exopolysaccharide biosynthesis